MTAMNSVSPDARALDGLRQQAARDPQAASRQVAVQFETLFMQSVLKSMRDATPREESSAAQENFTSMLDAQFARQFSGRPGGLAEMIERQLAAQMRNLPAAAAPAAAADDNSGAAPVAPATPSASSARPAKLSATQLEFMRRMQPHAEAAERRTGVPASFILGQAALESGWGRAQPRQADGTPSYNLFGIKAGASWRGATTASSTTEYVDGVATRQTERFRSYASYADAFTDYARLLADSPRYAGALRAGTSPEAFAGAMQRAGYATDPQYAAKLARTIHVAQAARHALG